MFKQLDDSKSTNSSSITSNRNNGSSNVCTTPNPNPRDIIKGSVFQSKSICSIVCSTNMHFVVLLSYDRWFHIVTNMKRCDHNISVTYIAFYSSLKTGYVYDKPLDITDFFTKMGTNCNSFKT